MCRPATEMHIFRVGEKFLNRFEKYIFPLLLGLEQKGIFLYAEQGEK